MIRAFIGPEVRQADPRYAAHVHDRTLRRRTYPDDHIVLEAEPEGGVGGFHYPSPLIDSDDLQTQILQPTRTTL